MNHRTESLGAILLACLGYFLWIHFTPEPVPVGQWTAAPVSKALKAVPMVDIQPKMVKVYAQSAKSKLKLPDAIQQDQNQYVIASSTLARDLRPVTVSSVINEQTGEVTTITRREEYPLFALEQQGEASISYGVKRGGDRVVRLSVSESIASIKAVHLGAIGSLDSDRAAYVGVGVGYRW